MPHLIKPSTSFPQSQHVPFFGFVSMTQKNKLFMAGCLALLIFIAGLSFIWLHPLRVEQHQAQVSTPSALAYTEPRQMGNEIQAEKRHAPQTLYRFVSENIVLIAIIMLTAGLSGYFFWRIIVRFTSPLQTLQQAISRREIRPFYQPFIHSDSGKIAGFEVLARWKHPTYGYVSPDVFIPLAERHQLIVPLTRLLMQQIISDLQQEIHRFPDEIYICINISPQNCLDPHFEDDIDDILLSLETKKRHIVIEMTERHPLHMTPQLNSWLAALRRANVSVALDDFGTGYSNLAWISALNPEFLKIDKMFVSQIGENSDMRLVESVIELAQKMHLKVIAEGVETQAQVDYLRARHIDYMQGYFFSRPLAAADLIERLAMETNPAPGY